MIWNRILNWFRDMSERIRLMNEWNKNAKEAYIYLELYHLCWRLLLHAVTVIIDMNYLNCLYLDFA